MFVIRTLGVNTPHHPGFNALFGFADAIAELAKELAQNARKQADARRPRIRRGATLRPGLDTPLWNAVVAMVHPVLQRRGAKASLARELGVHRARIGEYFDDRSAMPDAERALRLLVWLARHADPGGSPK
jgi:hypothetical protein